MFLAMIQTAHSLITLLLTAVRQHLSQDLHHVAFADCAELSDQIKVCTSSSNMD